MSDIQARCDQSNSFAYRAAEYFGYEREPRVSIPLTRPRGVAIVSKTQGRPILMLYREWPSISGDHVVLTERQRDQLVKALANV